MDLISLGQAQCTSSDGGIVEVLVVDAQFVTNVAVDVNQKITAFTMSTTGKWVSIKPDTDQDKPYYNQGGNRTGNKHVYDQEGLVAFSGLNNEKRLALQAQTDACALILVYITSTGLRMVQGIQWDHNTSTWSVSKKPAKATGTFNTNTGDTDDEMTIKYNSQTRYLSNYTELTRSAILAL